ncbi:MAG: uncharacterized protein QOK19_472 [Solirubrobacteraceae bacterium]|jgi:ketosteroid isomerase-like protein|nr:hypothetical protein [Solirubrobacterales bacterium]MEA2214911.1 uncharacterized protein [Solirubrobacteraceae bacterium]
MSQQNVENARMAIEAFNRGDRETAFERSHPDIEWVVARQHPSATTHRGPEAIAAYLREWQEAVDQLEFRIERAVDAGDAVVTIGKLRGVGVQSGAEIEIPIAVVSHMRDGMTVRVEEYLNEADALRAVGSTE